MNPQDCENWPEKLKNESASKYAMLQKCHFQSERG